MCNRIASPAARFLAALLVWCLLPFSALAADAVPPTVQPPTRLAPVAPEAATRPLPLQAAIPPQQPFRPDTAHEADRLVLETLQRDAFRYIWEDGHPVCGMAYESSVPGDFRPVAIGGTGFGIAAIVVGADRGWITRDEALARLRAMTLFLRDRTARKQLHGAFPHWIDGNTGATLPFGKFDTGADIVETALLMQGLLLARAYFNGPGQEEELRSVITELWEGVEWDWFTNGEDNGLYWHWSPESGFSHGLKILGYNECLIAYVLAASSPTNPITRKAYDYWTSGKGYQPKTLYGYRVEASLAGGGPLFLTQYSFVGLDPRRMADAFVPGGYFVRNVNQTLSNRGYALFSAPAKNRYAPDFWGLTASQIKGGYAANEPQRDNGTVAPTAALSAMPYTPHYSMQVLQNLAGPLREKMWGKNGPYDAASLRDNWFSNSYIAIDQLPIVCMVENYRSGLLWNLFMRDGDVRRGLAVAGIAEPALAEGFPEVVPALVRKGKSLVPDAHDLRRHPDTGLYMLPYRADAGGEVTFTFAPAAGGEPLHAVKTTAGPGGNLLRFPQFMPPDGTVLTLTMRIGEKTYTLPIRLH